MLVRCVRNCKEATAMVLLFYCETESNVTCPEGGRKLNYRHASDLSIGLEGQLRPETENPVALLAAVD